MKIELYWSRDHSTKVHYKIPKIKLWGKSRCSLVGSYSICFPGFCPWKQGMQRRPALHKKQEIKMWKHGWLLKICPVWGYEDCHKLRENYDDRLLKLDKIWLGGIRCFALTKSKTNNTNCLEYAGGDYWEFASLGAFHFRRNLRSFP